MIVKMGSFYAGFGGAAASAVLFLLCLAPAAAADSMVVQPDGKILLIGRTWPQAGALARLNPDGTIDRSFGQEGFVIDRRLPTFQALAQEADGRIVGAAVGGVRLGRYLADGTSDPTFAEGGVAGSEEVDQPFYYRLYPGGPAAIQLSPSGSITVAENHLVPAWDAEAWIKRYDANGTFVETVGHIGRSGPDSSVHVTDLLEEPNGSLVGAGSIYQPPPGESALLTRFLLGSGTEHDPSFGAGAGLVRLSLPDEQETSTRFRALAREGDKILAGGSAEGNFLVARFAPDGTPDQGFGQGGHSVLPIKGPSVVPVWAGNQAEDLATLGNGDVLLAGETSEWGSWAVMKLGFVVCDDCPQPLLAAADPNGHLDPSFGNGGVLPLSKPDGSVLGGKAEQVVPLADGKILVKGATPIPDSVEDLEAPFLARLNPDGSYDPTFGENGLTIVRFPCTDQPRAERRRLDCIATLRAKLGLGGLRQRRPVLSLRARSSLDWAGVSDLTLTLPRYLRLTRGFRSKVKLGGGGLAVHIQPPHDQKPYTVLTFSVPGPARQLRVRFEPGALHLRGFVVRRGLTFKLRAHFVDARWGTWAGHDEVTRRVG
jgi:uncharacterized delta-60 repeat protein